MIRPSGATNASSIWDSRGSRGWFAPVQSGSAFAAGDLSRERRGASRVARPSAKSFEVGGLLPDAAGLAAALVGVVAAAAGGAVGGLRDRERRARLRQRRHRVGAVADGGRLHLTLAGAEREAGSAGVAAARRAVGVVAGGVGRAALALRDEVAGVRLGLRVLALVLLAEEGRQCDRGENADDQDHHEELDEGETL